MPDLSRRLRRVFQRRNGGKKYEDSQEKDTSREHEHIKGIIAPARIPAASQLRYLPRLLGARERIIFRAAAVIFILAGILFVLSLGARITEFDPRKGGSFTEVLLGRPRLINPLWADANDADSDLTALIFSGLLRYNEEGELTADLAESFEISEDGKTYTFLIKEDAKWHDGRPVTAGDAVFTIRAAKNPSYGSPLQSLFAGIEAEAQGPRTVVFTLSKPFRPFPHLLTMGILPEHLWRNIAPKEAALAELNLKPIGAGPWKLKKIRKTKTGAIQNLELEPNDGYPGAEPLLDKLIFKFAPTMESAITALAQGNAEALAFPPRERIKELSRKTDLTFIDFSLPQITAVFFNQKRNPFLKEKSVRAALAHAVPGDRIISEAFGGAANPVIGPLLPGTPGYTEEVDRYGWNPDRARELFAEAGWKIKVENEFRVFEPKDSRDKRYTAGIELAVNLTTVDLPDYVRAAELIRDSWRSLGVKTEITTRDPNQLTRETVPSRDYDALLFGLIMNRDNDPYPFWHSSQIGEHGVNLSDYANRRADALIEEARTSREPAEIAARYEELQKIIAEEIPAVFLLQPTYIYALSKNVHGVNLGALGAPSDRFSSLPSWFVRTKPAIK